LCHDLIMLRRGLVKFAPYILLIIVGWAVWNKIVAPRFYWRQQAVRPLRALVVDYTVPFDNYKEHAGLLWLLSHLKIAPPDGANWDPSRHYLGYDPLNRPYPRRLASKKNWGYDLLYIADTYGVYEADLDNAKKREAHMDHSRLLFGGLGDADAAAAVTLAKRGCAVIVEFNTLCSPTADGARARMQALLGVRWTGWVGRMFVDPNNRNDVPHWFPRLYAKQYPGKKYPRRPMLALIHRSGTLVVLQGASANAVAPRIRMTGIGNLRFISARGGPPYPYWFSVVEAQKETAVLAEIELPQKSHSANPKRLKAAGIPVRIPLMTERRAFGGMQIYFAADFSDADFKLPPYRKAYQIDEKGKWVHSAHGRTGQDAFWRFYAVVMRQLLNELTQPANEPTRRDL
jgi:hypothetical protein